MHVFLLTNGASVNSPICQALRTGTGFKCRSSASKRNCRPLGVCCMGSLFLVYGMLITYRITFQFTLLGDCGVPSDVTVQFNECLIDFPFFGI